MFEYHDKNKFGYIYYDGKLNFIQLNNFKLYNYTSSLDIGYFNILFNELD